MYKHCIFRWFFLCPLLLLPLRLGADPAGDEQSSLSSEVYEKCSHIFQTSVRHYQTLGRLLPSTFKKVPQAATHQLLQLRAEDCRDGEIYTLINKALAAHTGKIGLLLPLSLWPIAVRQAVINQINKLVLAKGMDPAKSLIWMDTHGSKQKLETQLAQLIFVHHVSLLIGGLTNAEAPVLAGWAQALRIPAIILNRRNDRPSSKYAFFMGPDPRLLASSLTRHALSRRMRKITVIMPQTSRDGVLVDHFIQQAKHLQLEIDGPHLYNPHDYSSIDALLRKLFHIDDPARGEEQLELLSKMKEKAEKEGVPFDSRSVVLPPLLDCDGMLIVDHFKDVRHLARAMNFYGVKKLPLLGIPKWRAFELVDSSEEILKNAIFVDYLGSYQRLPYEIRPESLESEYFVKSSEVGAIDLQLLLSHAVYASMQAVRGERIPRFTLNRRLELSKPPPGDFFAAPSIFRKDRLAYWPSFVFSVGEKSLQMLQIWNPYQSEAQARSGP